MSNAVIIELIVLSYVPGYFLVRSLQGEGDTNEHSGDELGPGEALSAWLFSPVFVPFVAVVAAWFWVACKIFPEKKR